MAHYDIYADLGIDREQSSNSIVQEIDRRLAATDPSNVQEMDRLGTARKLFESESRRAAYDRALDDPHAPEINIPAFRSYAEGFNPAHDPFAAVSQSFPAQTPQPAPQMQQPFAAPQMQQPAAASVNMNLGDFGVSPERSRYGSMMWTIGYGFIFLTWILLLLMLLIGLLGDGADFINYPSGRRFGMTAIYVLLNTGGTLVFLEFFWHLRKLLGRK